VTTLSEGGIPAWGSILHPATRQAAGAVSTGSLPQAASEPSQEDPRSLAGSLLASPGGPSDADKVPATSVPFGLASLALLGWMLLAGVWLARGASHLDVRDPSVYGRWAFSHLAYTDLFQLYMTAHLASHGAPYVHSSIQYPVVTGIFMWLAAWAPGPTAYFALSALGLSLCALCVLWLLRNIVPAHYHWFAFLPLVAFYGLLNWDLLGIAFMLGGLEASRRNRLGWAGILIALGTFSKFFPLVVLAFLVVRLARLRDGRSLGRLTAGFLGTSVFLNIPFVLTSSSGWSYFFRYNLKRPGSMGLRWALVAIHARHVPTSVVDATTFGLTALVGLGCLIWVWRGGNLESSMAIAMVVFFFVNKVYSPQYTLWVLVFVMLAQWPTWIYGLLGAMGAMDYANSFIMLHFSQPAGRVTEWYYDSVFRWGVDLRYVVLAICAIVGVLCLLGHKETVWATHRL